mmetsp:Transcript_25906/g.22945  ORF Transcript_25906/g.22945 Transcript_25906/m.22945 type:complete len:155 (+) Transcript_25906:892-1356(+)
MIKDNSPLSGKINTISFGYEIKRRDIIYSVVKKNARVVINNGKYLTMIQAAEIKFETMSNCVKEIDQGFVIKAEGEFKYLEIKDYKILGSEEGTLMDEEIGQLFKTLHEEDQLQINEILILDISPFIVNDFSKGSILRCIKDGLRPIYHFEIFE